LAKKIEDRYADARQLLQDIERLLRGKASNIAVHPQTPPHDADEVLEETFQWQLRAAPSDLWPHVSNTERINAAVGVPSVVYRTGRDERGRLRKYGSFRLAGIPIGWEEHPFEWVEGQQLGILREFQQGPFEWFLSLVELRPQSGGGTLLQHRVRVKPRGLVGRMLARLEVSIKGKRNLDRVYRRIDDAVSGRLGGEPTIDPFAQPKKLAAGRRQRLDERLGKLAERGVSQQVLACLAEFLRESPAQELARIRPLALARNFHVPAEPLVEGCLLAAKEGLLDLHWDILCPTCRISSQVVDTLQAIENHVRCEACDLDFNVDLASSVEMIFRVSPEIREADLGTYCIGGPEHSPHVVLQVRIEAGKRLEVTPVLSEGEYILRSPQLAMVVRLRALPGRGTANSEIVLLAGLAADHVAQVRAGRNVLSITNDCDQELIVRLERTVPRQDVLTAAQAATMPAFREFFPNESPKPGQLLNVATVTLLAVDIPDTSPLYFELEDAAAYSLVQRFHRTIEQTLRKHGGAMIKTAGTAVLFVFETPRNVIPAVVELSAALQQDRGNVPFCATAHRGTALATSSGGHLDLFGGTVHLVERLLRLAGSGELLVTEAVAAEQTVVAAMGQAGLTAEFCDFHQLSRGGMRCRRLRLT
jgi:class 3 adenylate cyclase